MMEFIQKEEIVVNKNDKILTDKKVKEIEYKENEKIIILHPKTKRKNIIYLEKYDGFSAKIIEKEEGVYYLYVVYETGEKNFYRLEE